MASVRQGDDEGTWVATQTADHATQVLHTIQGYLPAGGYQPWKEASSERSRRCVDDGNVQLREQDVGDNWGKNSKPR